MTGFSPLQHEADALRTDTDRAALQAAGLLNDDPVVIAAAGKDPLRLRANGGTYWVARVPPGPAPKTFEKQF